MLDTRNFVVRTLLADELITEADLHRAQQHALASGKDVLDSMAQLGIATPRRLAIANAKICEYPFVDLQQFDIDLRNAKHIPRTVAERVTAFALFIVDNVATVAMHDPLNLQAIDQIRQLLRCDVDPVVCDVEQLRALISRAYSMIQHSQESEGGASDDKQLTTGQEPIVEAVNHILLGAADAASSDIHINPEERDLILRYRVDGVLQKLQGPPRSAHEAIVQRLKVLAKLDVTQTRKPQDGKFRFKHRNDNIDVRLSITPTIHGENVVMRLLRAASKIGTIKDLGMSDQMTKWFEDAITSHHGMILVTGPTGSGKTTTLYTALSHLNKPDVNIMTIEDPVEVRLPMIRQVQANADIGLTFATALRSFLRQDPDIILVGEIRDEETAQIAVQSAMTGHLVFSTLHTNDSIGSIQRLANMGVPSYVLGSTMTAAISQRLVRKLCDTCSVPETNFAMLRRVPASLKSHLYRTHIGCGACRGTGYTGRIAVFEMLRVTARLRPLIENRASESTLLEAAKADGFESLFHNGVVLASHGLTSLDEVVPLAHPFLDAEVFGTSHDKSEKLEKAA